MKRFAAVGLATAALVGCGGSSTESASTEPTSNTEVIEQAESEAVSAEAAARYLVRELDAKPDALGTSLEYRADGARDTCSLILVLNTPEEIALYEDAGDSILKNPSGTVGVKLSTTAADEVACMKAMDEALQGL